MEFLQIFLILIALIIAYKWPDYEKLAFFILMASWVFMIYFYIGHKSSNIFSSINL